MWYKINSEAFLLIKDIMYTQRYISCHNQTVCDKTQIFHKISAILSLQ